MRRRKKDRARGGAFDTHPVTSERISYLEEMAKNNPGTGETGFERYRAVMDPYVGEWLRSDLRRKDFGQSLYIINKLIGHGRNLGVLYFYQGEAYRLRRTDGDKDRALSAYQAALGHDDAPADAYREAGQLYWDKGALPQARGAFETYLEKAPDAQDRLIVQDYIRQVSM